MEQERSKDTSLLEKLRGLAWFDAKRRPLEERLNRIDKQLARVQGGQDGAHASSSSDPCEHRAVSDVGLTTPPPVITPLTSPRTRAARRLVGGLEGPLFRDGEKVMGCYKKDKQWFPAVVEEYDPQEQVYVITWMDRDPKDRRKKKEELRHPLDCDLDHADWGIGVQGREEHGGDRRAADPGVGRVSSPVEDGRAFTGGRRGFSPDRAAREKAARQNNEGPKARALEEAQRKLQKMAREIDRAANPQPPKRRKQWDCTEREDLRLRVEALDAEHQPLIAQCCRNALPDVTPGVRREGGAADTDDEGYSFDFGLLKKGMLSKIEKALDNLGARSSSSDEGSEDSGGSAAEEENEENEENEGG